MTNPQFLAVLVSSLAGILIAVAVGVRPLLRSLRQRETVRAMQLFRVQREQLEAKFADLAARQGKPRGLRWTECDFQDEVAFGRDLQSGLLTAFVSVHISFEAIEGGDMEEVEAVGLLRDAAALFHFRQGNWSTGGRALFNMNPVDALERLNGQFEPVRLPAARAESESGTA